MAASLPPTLLVWDRIGDYHAVRFRTLQQLNPDSAVHLADLGGSDGIYGWNNPVSRDPHYHALSPLPVGKPDLMNRFRNFRQLVHKENIRTVGLAGYGRPEYHLFLWWCKLKGISVVLFAESWYGQNRWINALKGWYLQFLCAGFLVSGKRALHHFQGRLGIRKPMQIGYSVVDNAHFAQNPVPRQSPPVLLCVARFAPEKNLAMLLEAFGKSRLSETWELWLVGGGPEKNLLLGKSRKLKGVLLKDWLSYSELPALYQSASAFVLPSRFEPWGLVVNEAMAAGLPLVLSDACGCVPELAGSENALIFKTDDLEDLVRCLDILEEMTAQNLSAMGEASRKRIPHFSPETWARSFAELCHLG
jgi:glycosyltransferase involved in cell wall biosynthesis